MSKEQVKVTVIRGSVNTVSNAAYKKGESFTTSRFEAEGIDPAFVRITLLNSEPEATAPPVQVPEPTIIKPAPQPTVKKRVTKVSSPMFTHKTG